MEKIKSWEDLNDMSNLWYYITVGDHSTRVYIRALSTKTNPGPATSAMDVSRLSTERVITWLSWFGFEVEFVKQPVLSQREHNFLVAFGSGYIVRCHNADLRCYSAWPKKARKGWSLEHPYATLPREMFQFIEYTSKPVAVEDMLTWGVEK